MPRPLNAPRQLVAGNWKMNGLRASVAEIDALKAEAAGLAAELLVCPPATLLLGFGEVLKGSGIALGGQDCRAKPAGAFTGDISPEMLRDAGASYVIVGHSERRALHGERDRDIRAKAEASLRAALHPIICIGETAGERRFGRTLDVIGRQLQAALPDDSGISIAYEPVWAIGTGLVASLADIAEVHGFIRAHLRERFGPTGNGVRLLYGGSVKPENAKAIMELDNVDGALVGGASLKAADFLAIARAA